MKYKCTEVTRNKIKKAFLELTNVKPANKIFVKEIIQVAGISRACFYVHYENIGALIHEIGNDTVKNVMEIIKNDKGNFKKYHIVVMGAGLSYKLTNMIVKNLNSKNHPNRK